MRYWLKRKAADALPAHWSKLRLKKRNKMNFGLTPLCLKSLCDNDSLLPTHTPALRAGMAVSKPNTCVAGETHSRSDSSSLYQYMKYIWGTPAMLRPHSLAELMLFEQAPAMLISGALIEHCQQLPRVADGDPWEWALWNSPELLIFSLRLSESQCRKHAKSILTLNHNEMLSKRLDLQKASKDSPWSSVSSWGGYSSTDQEIKLYVQVQFPPQSPILQSYCASGIKLLPLQTQQLSRGSVLQRHRAANSTFLKGVVLLCGFQFLLKCVVGVCFVLREQKYKLLLQWWYDLMRK